HYPVGSRPAVRRLIGERDLATRPECPAAALNDGVVATFGEAAGKEAPETRPAVRRADEDRRPRPDRGGQVDVRQELDAVAAGKADVPLDADTGCGRGRQAERHCGRGGQQAHRRQATGCPPALSRSVPLGAAGLLQMAVTRRAHIGAAIVVLVGLLLLASSLHLLPANAWELFWPVVLIAIECCSWPASSRAAACTRPSSETRLTPSRFLAASG